MLREFFSAVPEPGLGHGVESVYGYVIQSLGPALVCPGDVLPGEVRSLALQRPRSKGRPIMASRGLRNPGACAALLYMSAGANASILRCCCCRPVRLYQHPWVPKTRSGQTAFISIAKAISTLKPNSTSLTVRHDFELSHLSLPQPKGLQKSELHNLLCYHVPTVWSSQADSSKHGPKSGLKQLLKACDEAQEMIHMMRGLRRAGTPVGLHQVWNPGGLSSHVSSSVRTTPCAEAIRGL